MINWELFGVELASNRGLCQSHLAAMSFCVRHIFCMAFCSESSEQRPSSEAPRTANVYSLAEQRPPVRRPLREWHRRRQRAPGNSPNQER